MQKSVRISYGLICTNLDLKFVSYYPSLLLVHHYSALNVHSYKDASELPLEERGHP